MTTLARVPSAIDVTHLPAPNAIDVPDYAALKAAFIERFLVSWRLQRAKYPALPDYDVGQLETDPFVIAAEAWSYLRRLDRERVNDAVRALLPAFSTGSDLDHLVAGANLVRLQVAPADPLTGRPAVMESDAQLLRRYLAAFDAPAAGSIDGYIFRALTAWPAMHDCTPLGYGIHGRRGEMDIVITGQGGRAPTEAEHALVRAAVTTESAHPASTAVTVINARRVLYSVALELIVPPGPDPSLIRTTAQAAALEAAQDRNRIGAEVPLWAIAGAAYSPNVIRVRETSGFTDIPADPYAIPVCTGVSVTTVVQQ